ncbi:hypothetical protein TSMEX_005598, partial [Taenia solium]
VCVLGPSVSINGALFAVETRRSNKNLEEELQFLSNVSVLWRRREALSAGTECESRLRYGLAYFSGSSGFDGLDEVVSLWGVSFDDVSWYGLSGVEAELEVSTGKISRHRVDCTPRYGVTVPLVVAVVTVECVCGMVGDLDYSTVHPSLCHHKPCDRSQMNFDGTQSLSALHRVR